MFDQVMADIETMSTDTSRALILSLALTPFSFRGDAPIIGRSSLIILDQKQQELMGRDVIPKTKEWWADQTPEARAHWEDPAFDSTEFDVIKVSDLNLLSDTIAKVFKAYVEPEFRIWTNGVKFDLANLENLLTQLGATSFPWGYNWDRDHRTIIKSCDKVRHWPGEEFTINGNAHDPVSDNIYQIKTLYSYAPERIIKAKQLLC